MKKVLRNESTVSATYPEGSKEKAFDNPFDTCRREQMIGGWLYRACLLVCFTSHQLVVIQNLRNASLFPWKFYAFRVFQDVLISLEINNIPGNRIHEDDSGGLHNAKLAYEILLNFKKIMRHVINQKTRLYTKNVPTLINPPDILSVASTGNWVLFMHHIIF